MTTSSAIPRPSPDVALGHIERLPTLPAVATRVLEVVTDRASSARDLVALLRNDQSLTAKILSVASSVGAAARNVRTLEQAVPLLGYAAIRSIVLSTTVFEFFRTQGNEQRGAFDRKEFWLHSVAVACAARRLAADAPALKIDPEHAYVAGLLHDLGKVALDVVFPKAYDRIAQQALEERCDIADVERRILGVDHTRAGRRLAEQWRLPSDLRDVIWLHHLSSDGLPSTVASARLVTLVQLADTVAREQRVGFSGNFLFFERSNRLAEQIGIAPAQLEDTLNALLGEANEQAAQLGLESESAEKRYVKAMSDANAELGRMNTELAVSNRRLAAAARFFQAISAFEQRVGAWTDLSTVVAALADAALLALQLPTVIAFGLYEDGASIETAWRIQDGAGGVESIPAAPEELREYLSRPREGSDALLIRLPPELRRGFSALSILRDQGPVWFAPIWQNDRCVGGLVSPAPDGASPRVDDGDDLRALLDSLGLALSRANAQHAARRLTDDLAETNRRLQRMQTELLRSRTLSMIAEMAAGAGHELNSPLTVISGRAQMLAQELDNPEQLRWLQIISGKAHECSRIVSELMDFARPKPAQFTSVNLTELLAQVCEEFLRSAGFDPARLRQQFREAGDAETATGDSETAAGSAPAAAGSSVACSRAPAFRPGTIDADPVQLAVLFTELLTNAAAAVQETAGQITITCSRASVVDCVQVDVCDQGVGMAPAVQERVFDPFYSFRQAGRRRGLGLARAFRIVETHKGRIWLESAVGVGTTMHVLLPRVQASPA